MQVQRYEETGKTQNIYPFLLLLAPKRKIPIALRTTGIHL
jgi:hypothetical protein